MIIIKSIDDHIPLPAASAAGSPNTIIRSMVVGQSFFLAGRDRRSLCGFRDYWRRQGFRFAMRKEGSGTRVWLVDLTEAAGR
jgi:hypothetical protein